MLAVLVLVLDSDLATGSAKLKLMLSPLASLVLEVMVVSVLAVA